MYWRDYDTVSPSRSSGMDEQHLLIRRSSVEQIERVVWTKDLATHHLLCFQVLQGFIGIGLVTGQLRSTQGLQLAQGASGGQWTGGALGRSGISKGRGATRDGRQTLGMFERRRLCMDRLAPIPLDVLIGLVAIETFAETIVGLALPARSGEVTFLALATAAHTRRITRIIDTAQIALDLAATTRDTRLVDSLVLLRRAFCFGLQGRQVVPSLLWRRCRHDEQRRELATVDMIKTRSNC